MKNLKTHSHTELFSEGKRLLNCTYMENTVTLTTSMKKLEQRSSDIIGTQRAKRLHKSW